MANAVQARRPERRQPAKRQAGGGMSGQGPAGPGLGARQDAGGAAAPSPPLTAFNFVPPPYHQSPAERVPAPNVHAEWNLCCKNAVATRAT